VKATAADLRGLVPEYERWASLKAAAGGAGGGVEAAAAEAVTLQATAKATADAAAARVAAAERVMQDVVWPACGLAADAGAALAEVARLGFAAPPAAPPAAAAAGGLSGLTSQVAPSGSTVVPATEATPAGSLTQATAGGGGGGRRPGRRFQAVKDADAALEALEADRASVEGARAAALRDLESARSALASAQQELHAVREAAAAARAAAARRAAAEARADELVAAAGRLRTDAASADAGVAAASDALEAAIRERDAVRATGRAAEGAASSASASSASAADKVALLECAVGGGRGDDRAAALEAAVATLEAAKAAHVAADAAATAAKARATDLSVRAGSSEATRRQLEDCLAAAEAREAMHGMEAAAKAAEAAAGAKGDLAALRSAAAHAASAAVSARSDADRARGSLAQAEEASARTTAELAASPQAATAAADHLARVAAARAGEAASRDLDKYGKALEAALLAFHAARMRDVNATIKELWQKTYRHGDIDFIQVRADADGAAGARSGGRSYNYRLVMMAGGAELEMRGRCSAGQKVLACIIMRLALAEVFGLDCGILALDEPTTNLDEPNAAALAEALRAVMDDRRGQANFQLIVITHDERFAQLLGTRDLADHMWRVRKDERQMSMLVREDVSG
jgi:DNA repair protein RAD50